MNYGNMTSSTVRITIPKIELEQTGTYQCSVLRRCHPIAKKEAKDDSEQEPVAITKSLYMKVYPFPDYQPDLVVALSGLAVTSVILLVIHLEGNGIRRFSMTLVVR